MNKTLNYILCTLALLPCVGMLNGNIETVYINAGACFYAFILYQLSKTANGRKITKRYIKTTLEIIKNK